MRAWIGCRLSERLSMSACVTPLEWRIGTDRASAELVRYLYLGPLTFTLFYWRGTE